MSKFMIIAPLLAWGCATEQGVADDEVADEKDASPSYDCPADHNQDGVVNFWDYLAFRNDWNAGAKAADFNSDEAVNVQDFMGFTDAYASGC